MKDLWSIFIFFCTQNGNETNTEVKKNSQSQYDCWFSVSRHSEHIKIKIKTVQWLKSGIWEMKRGKYTKTEFWYQSEKLYEN